MKEKLNILNFFGILWTSQIVARDPGVVQHQNLGGNDPDCRF